MSAEPGQLTVARRIIGARCSRHEGGVDVAAEMARRGETSSCLTISTGSYHSAATIPREIGRIWIAAAVPILHSNASALTEERAIVTS